MDREIVLVLGIDPGEKIGFSYGRGSFRQTSQERPYADLLCDWAVEWQTEPPDRLAVERFNLRLNTPDAALTIEVIGAIKHLAYLHSIPIGWVNPADKHKMMSQAHESIVGGHARDAEAVRLWDLNYGTWQ